jgi:hypothetical protein
MNEAEKATAAKPDALTNKLRVTMIINRISVLER